MLTDAIGVLRPDLITAYHAQMSSQGYDELSLLLLLYSVILAPVIEETVFRGLVFRYARMPCHSGLQTSCRLRCSDLYT